MSMDKYMLSKYQLYFQLPLMTPTNTSLDLFFVHNRIIFNFFFLFFLMCGKVRINY